ncbi:MAG: hypothetical protein LBR14_04100 [Clostridiales Family XIII bacterium]|jgi:O-antigen/teichoic acid export membrane protein|nr:hypothetical protein [Clostridiales Family XIII bacterium]
MALKQGDLKKDYVFNTLGVSINAFLSLFLLIVVARVNGITDTGVFSFCYAYATVFFTIGYYGGRIYQVSDTGGQNTNAAYLLQKFITCTIMLALAGGFVLINGYDAGKAAVLLVLVLFKYCEAVSDVLYGAMQRSGKLYLSGISLTMKGLLAIIVFLAIDVRTGDMVKASLGIFAVNLLVMACYDLPNFKRYREKQAPKPLREELANAWGLMGKTVYVFLLSFFGQMLVNIPRYVVDIYHEEMQGYFGIVIMPASAVALFGIFVLQPQVVPLTQRLERGDKEGFRRDVRRLVGISVIFGLVATAAAYALGAPVLTLIYDVDMSSYRLDIAIIVLGGTVNVVVMLLSNVLVIMRKFAVQMFLFGGALALNAVLCYALVIPYVVLGGALVYLIVNVLQGAGYLFAYRSISR